MGSQVFHIVERMTNAFFSAGECKAFDELVRVLRECGQDHGARGVNCEGGVGGGGQGSAGADSSDAGSSQGSFEYMVGFRGGQPDIPVFPKSRSDLLSRMLWASSWMWRAVAFNQHRPKDYQRLYYSVRDVNKAFIFGVFTTVYVRGGSCGKGTCLWKSSSVSFVFVAGVVGHLEFAHAGQKHMLMANQCFVGELSGEIHVEAASSECSLVLMTTPHEVATLTGKQWATAMAEALGLRELVQRGSDTYRKNEKAAKRRRREVSCVSARMAGPQAAADGPANAVVAPQDAPQAEAGGDHHERQDLAPAIVVSPSSDTGTAGVTMVALASAGGNSVVGSCDAVARAAATKSQLGDLLGEEKPAEHGSVNCCAYPWHQGDLVHRYFDGRGVPEATVALWRMSLQSWAGAFVQYVWCADVAEGQRLLGMAAENIVFREAELLVPGSTWRRWMGWGLPPKLFKEIFSLECLQQYGGWWADLDVCRVGPPPAEVAGAGLEVLLFSDGDPMVTTGQRPRRRCGRKGSSESVAGAADDGLSVHMALLYSRVTATPLRRWVSQCEQHWQKHAVQASDSIRRFIARSAGLCTGVCVCAGQPCGLPAGPQSADLDSGRAGHGGRLWRGRLWRSSCGIHSQRVGRELGGVLVC